MKKLFIWKDTSLNLWKVGTRKREHAIAEYESWGQAVNFAFRRLRKPSIFERKQAA